MENGNAERRILLQRTTLFLLKLKKLSMVHMKFEVFTAVTLNITISWDVTVLLLLLLLLLLFLLLLLLLLLIIIFIIIILFYHATVQLGPWPLKSSASRHHYPVPTFSNSCILLASLSTASDQLPLGLPTGLLPSMYPFSAFLGTLSSFILITWPTYWSLLNLISLVSFISLYNL